MRRIRFGHRRERVRPHVGPLPEDGHIEGIVGAKSGALRAAIFGVNDGLVSNLALIMGVAGAGVSSDVVLVAGAAGLLAGAFSMAAGERCGPSASCSSVSSTWRPTSSAPIPRGRRRSWPRSWRDAASPASWPVGPPRP